MQLMYLVYLIYLSIFAKLYHYSSHILYKFRNLNVISQFTQSSPPEQMVDLVRLTKKIHATNLLFYIFTI